MSDLGVVTGFLKAKPIRHPLWWEAARRRALVSQLAEETDSKPVQCGFESHRGHQETAGQTLFSWDGTAFKWATCRRRAAVAPAASSKASAIRLRSSRNRCPYRSSVSVAVLCPNSVWSTFTFAGSNRQTRARVPQLVRRQALLIDSLGGRIEHRPRSSSRRAATGTATRRRRALLSRFRAAVRGTSAPGRYGRRGSSSAPPRVPSPVTLVTERLTRMRRAFSSTLPTRSAAAPPNRNPQYPSTNTKVLNRPDATARRCSCSWVRYPCSTSCLRGSSIPSAGLAGRCLAFTAYLNTWLTTRCLYHPARAQALAFEACRAVHREAAHPLLEVFERHVAQRHIAPPRQHQNVKQ